MSDFSERPFAVGSLFGIRSFRVTSDGVLTGVHQQLPWHYGTNDAVCARPALAFAAACASVAQFAWSLERLTAQCTGRVLLKKRPQPSAVPPEYATGTLGCTCGFYAYFDLESNPHHLPGNVLGIVEGFGVTTVGSRGFRSSKARIRALIDSDSALARVLPNYPDVPVFPSMEAALAEFPLSAPPEGVSKPEPLPWSVWVPIRGRDNASRALHRLAASMSPPTLDETPQERALRLRRERNTGPADSRGLDGHHRGTR